MAIGQTTHIDRFQKLVRTLQKVLDAGVGRVLLVVEFFNIILLYLEGFVDWGATNTIRELLPQTTVFERDNLIRCSVSGTRARFIDALSPFCRETKCQVTVPFEGDFVPSSWDYGHLTEGGAKFLAEEIITTIRD